VTEQVWDPAVLELSGELLDRAAAEGATLRALGGVAVALRCPSAGAGGALARRFSDVDFAVRSGEQKATAAAMRAVGLAPVVRFNATQGASRLLFEREDGLHADVFVGRFALCHELPLARRLGVDERTLPLADLLLTKLQVAQLNRKDVTDAAALLLDHELTDDDAGVNATYVAGVLAADWGWWRTVTDNLATVRSLAGSLPLAPAEQAIVERRLDELAARIDAAPKGRRWRLRARVGERRPWRVEPEERA
jgi:hypothetical protein